MVKGANWGRELWKKQKVYIERCRKAEWYSIEIIRLENNIISGLRLLHGKCDRKEEIKQMGNNKHIIIESGNIPDSDKRRIRAKSIAEKFVDKSRESSYSASIRYYDGSPIDRIMIT